VAEGRGRERRNGAMTMRRWAARVSGVLLSVIVAGGLIPATLRAQSKPPPAAPADTSASAAKFQAAMAEWKSKIVPAAKKEGEVIWYSCAQATEAEGTIKVFNKAYPDIQVSQVLGPGYQMVEKISTEAAAGREAVLQKPKPVGGSRAGVVGRALAYERSDTLRTEFQHVFQFQQSKPAESDGWLVDQRIGIKDMLREGGFKRGNCFFIKSQQEFF